MKELCTGCLCADRKLVLLHETQFYHIYSQILNEIQVYNVSGVVIKICWECHAMLRRMLQFKDQVKRSYIDLMQCTAIPSVPRLSSHLVKPFDPAPIKLELPLEQEIKSELDLDEDVSGAAFADDLTFEDKPTFDDCDDDQFHDEDYEPEPEEPKKKIKLKKTEKKYKKKKKKRKKVKESIVEDGEEHGGEVMIEVPLQWKEEQAPGDETSLVTEVLHQELPATRLAAPPPRKAPRGPEPATVDGKPKCEECGKIFSSKKTYRYHMNVLHKGNNQYPCPRCGKVYQWKSNLGRHMRTHKAVDSGELHCLPCDKSFASVATYRQHLKISRRHVAETDFAFVCNECGKKFVNKTRLRDHIDWEHLKKIKFRCQLCDKAFKCHTSLYVHTQNVHRSREKKDNLCHVCGKSYQNAAKLKYHITAMHSGASPYRCGECGAAFGWYSSLYRHLRELHYKMKVTPKKAKKSKKITESLPPMLPPLYPMQPPG